MYHYIILNIIIIALQRDCVLRTDSSIHRFRGMRVVRSDSNLGLSCRKSNVFASYPADVEHNNQRDFER